MQDTLCSRDYHDVQVSMINTCAYRPLYLRKDQIVQRKTPLFRRSRLCSGFEDNFIEATNTSFIERPHSWLKWRPIHASKDAPLLCAGEDHSRIRVKTNTCRMRRTSSEAPFIQVKTTTRKQANTKCCIQVEVALFKLIDAPLSHPSPRKRPTGVVCVRRVMFSWRTLHICGISQRGVCSCRAYIQSITNTGSEENRKYKYILRTACAFGRARKLLERMLVTQIKIYWLLKGLLLLLTTQKAKHYDICACVQERRNKIARLGHAIAQRCIHHTWNYHCRYYFTHIHADPSPQREWSPFGRCRQLLVYFQPIKSLLQTWPVRKCDHDFPQIRNRPENRPEKSHQSKPEGRIFLPWESFFIQCIQKAWPIR